MSKHRVHFEAHKPVKEMVRVSFQTKDGPVSFKAKEAVLEPVEVSFRAKNK